MKLKLEYNKDNVDKVPDLLSTGNIPSKQERFYLHKNLAKTVRDFECSSSVITLKFSIENCGDKIPIDGEHKSEKML